MTEMVRKERSPCIKLLLTCLIGLALVIPLMMVYALVWDRQSQSETAQGAINAGWGGPQVLAGPVVVVPFRTTETQNETGADGKTTTGLPPGARRASCSGCSSRASPPISAWRGRRRIHVKRASTLM